jgi:tetratricopeptide (TPR) repeat protein
LALLCSLLLSAWCTVMFGRVQGEEFSPASFRRRTFSYYEVPVLRLQIGPVVCGGEFDTLEGYFAKQPFIAADSSPPRWDLVQCVRALSGAVQGDAAILCQYLDARTPDGEFCWLEWSKARPQLAEVLWPAVADMARQQLYILIPELIRAAKQARDRPQLERQLRVALTANCRRLAEARQRLADHAGAVRLYTAALRYDPRGIELLRGRAESFQALSKREKAAGDLAKAAELSPNPR